MALEKQVLYDKIEIFPETGIMQVRERTRIIEDGKIISQSNTNRKVIAPDQSVDDLPQEIQEIAARVRTPEKVAAYVTNKQQIQDIKNKGARQ